MIYFNIHSHVFTMTNAPQNFLRLFLPTPIANFVDTATNTIVGTKLFAGLISKFGEGGKRYANFLRIGKSKSQLAVFEELMQQYSDNSMQFVALTLNMEYIGAGASESLFEGQLAEVIKIKEKYPDRIILFLGLDPRWLNGNSIKISRAVQAKFETKIKIAGDKEIFPFAGLKIYTSTGFYVFDQRLKDTFDWAADNDVPIISHTNYLGGLFNYDKKMIIENLKAFNPYTDTLYDPQYKTNRNIWKWLTGTNENTLNKQNCSYFLEPDTFASVFDYYEKRGKKLKICLAHFGGSEQILAAKGTKDPEQAKPYGIKGTNWFNQIQDLMSTYKGAYTDISYDVAEGAHKSKSELFDIFYQEMNKEYGNKILFGTDYFMSEKEGNEAETYNRFRNFASKNKLDKWNNTMWDQIAGINNYDFLKSKYFP